MADTGAGPAQTLWGRRHPQLLQIAVEEVRLLLRGDAHAAVCHRQQHLSAAARSVTVTSPPEGVYFTALDSRFHNSRSR